MLSSPYLSLLGILALVLLSTVCLVRWWLLPKPIPGIPYKESSAKRLLGDGLPLLRWKAEHGEMFSYIANLAYELDTPIFQMFARPGGKPWVVVADHQEAYDIMVRRTKDFDRSKFFGDIWEPVVPHMHAHMPTGDEWRAHRRLLGDTMTPSFLHSVAAPQMVASTQNLIDLWRAKARLAHGRPFAVAHDLHQSALEIIWAATFGFETGAARAQTTLLSTLSRLDDANLEDNREKPAVFPTAPEPPEFEAIMTLSNGLGIGVQSLVPRLHMRWAFGTFPSLVKAGRIKDRLIQTQLRKAVEKFSARTDKGTGKRLDDLDLEDAAHLGAHMKSALDMVIARELQQARKEGRAPQLMGRVLQDELFGFLVAGHETSSTTLSWALKYLTAHQDVQARLREALHNCPSFRRARAQQEQEQAAAGTGENSAASSPTAAEIVAANVPYLSAVLEETTRCGLTTVSTIRQTQRDVYVLGHLVPKDTEVLMINNGPGHVLPPLSVDDATRSKTSQAAKGRVRDWDPVGIEAFHPDRWLVQDAAGQTVFDDHAGPTLGFGAGPRACFGRRWAQLELKIILVLIIWNFALDPTPPELSSFMAEEGMTRYPKQSFVSLRSQSL